MSMYIHVRHCIGYISHYDKLVIGSDSICLKPSLDYSWW